MRDESRDHAMEQLIGRFLQIGVMLAALVVLIGATLLLVQHGRSPVSYAVFQTGPAQLRTIGGIIHGVFALDSKAIVQLGLVLLIAFAVQRDRIYVAISTVVLALLLYSLLLGRA